jgi:hypothetical protein
MSLAHEEEEKDYVTAWRDKIEEWLQEEGWTVGHETASGSSWVLTARDACQHRLKVPRNHRVKIPQVI